MKNLTHCISSGQCSIGEVEGFLKYRCPSDRVGWEKSRCHNTEEYYFIRKFFDGWLLIAGQLCANDTHYYQACHKKLSGYKITNSKLLCGNWLCQELMTTSLLMISQLASLELYGKICDGEQFCTNNLDEANCTANTTKLRSGKEVEPSFICDDKCDIQDCEDEANCNGLTYGIYCKYNDYYKGIISGDKYVPPGLLCKGPVRCLV